MRRILYSLVLIAAPACDRHQAADSCGSVDQVLWDEPIGTGIEVHPAPGAYPDHDGCIWIRDATGAEGGEPDVECTFEPHPQTCGTSPLLGRDSWSLTLEGDGAVAGLAPRCLCADVRCTSVEDGVVLREWTWETGRCAR